MLCTRLTNARLLTMDPRHPGAHDLGIRRGRVVGVDEAVTSLPAREVVDLDGAIVLPGFTDSHVHLAWAGLKAGTPSIAPCERVEGILAVVDAAARDDPHRVDPSRIGDIAVVETFVDGRDARIAG